MKRKLMLVMCGAVVCITLSLGLWPFHAPRNTVTWMGHDNGVTFGRTGTMYTFGPLATSGSSPDIRGSIEMWIEPSTWDSATILSLYRPEIGLLVKLRQWYDDLDLIVETKVEGGRTTTVQSNAEEIFLPALRQKIPEFLTVTVGPLGTKVYRNGALYTSFPRFWIPSGAFGGRLIVGDAPGQPDSFRGQIRGLALYGVELSDAEVLRHYQDWTLHGRPGLDQEQHDGALYLFDEKAGEVVHNQYGPPGDLHIPARYIVVDKLTLEPFWREFEFSRSYWRGNLKNIIGFVPLGACFFAYFAPVRARRKALLLTLVAGFLVSLTIEAGQSFLPDRDSGTTDIITNTLGTWMGVLCYERFRPAFLRKS